MLIQQTQELQTSKIVRINSLVNMATPLLTLITYIKHTSEHPNIAKFRAQLIEEIKAFEQKLEKVKYPMRLIVAARYCLCTAIDEAVLGRPWGTQSIWVQQTLLSLFHKETWGGERFYIILEELAKEPRQHIDFLEFAYVLLSLGFEGKFFGAQLAIREEIRNRIFYRIRYSKEKPDKKFSKQEMNSAAETKTSRDNSIKKIGLLTIVVLTGIMLFYNIKLAENATSLINTLDDIGNVSAVTTFSQVIQRPVIERGMN